MMKEVEIKNRQEILDELIERMIKFDAECDPYQMDVYLYVDDDCNARLENFQNVGGNSWLNDDHYRIYCYNPIGKDIFEAWNDAKEISEAIGIDYADVESGAESENVDVYEYLRYYYKNEIAAANMEILRDSYSDYERMAEECIDLVNIQ